MKNPPLRMSRFNGEENGSDNSTVEDCPEPHAATARAITPVRIGDYISSGNPL